MTFTLRNVADPHSVDPPEADRRSARPLATAALTFASIAGFAVLLALHGLLPGQSQPTVQAHLASGTTECLSRLGIEALWQRCGQLGAPGGFPLLSGTAQLYPSVALSHLPLIDSWTAHVLVDIACVSAGYVAMIALLTRYGARPWAAVGASFGYLASQAIVGINGFAFTFNGFVLLPAAALMVTVAADAWAGGRRMPAAALMLGAELLMVFTDGYAFVEGALVGLALVLASSLHNVKTWRRRLEPIFVYVASVGTAAIAYTVWIPDGAYGTDVAAGAFRSMSLDIATVVTPQANMWWASGVGIEYTFDRGWGDYSAYAGNYLGFGLLGLLAWALWRRRQTTPVVVSLAVAALIAFVLALGPALKAWSFVPLRDVGPATHYDMPASEARLGMPTAFLFEMLPGLSEMRATYRWIIVVVFCLFCVGALAVSALERSGRRGLAVGLAVLALVEVLPNIGEVIEEKQSLAKELQTFREGPGAELAAIVGAADDVLFLPAGNDFTVVSMIPASGASTFNVGIDKNVAFARTQWPVDVWEAIKSYGSPLELEATARALATEATVVLLPRFNLLHSAVEWPLDDDPAGVAAALHAEAFGSDDRFRVEQHEYFYEVRLAD